MEYLPRSREEREEVENPVIEHKDSFAFLATVRLSSRRSLCALAVQSLWLRLVRVRVFPFSSAGTG